MRLIKAMAPAAFVLAAVVFFTANTLPMKQDYDKQWKRVDSLSDLRQPRSAIEVVEDIYQLAKSEENTAQVIKANLYRIKLMSEFEEDYLVKSIDRLKEELRQAETPEQQLLHSILGELYTRYYQMNRHIILDRERIAGSPGDDIRTWDVAVLADAARNHFLASLENKDQLQKIDIDAFQAILEKEKESEGYRPMLYDFLAFRAIEYFSNTEMELPVAAAQYIPDNPDLFSPVEDFIAVKIDSQYQNANTALALETYQQVLAFHLDDNDPQALIDADLHRLEFLHNRAVVAKKDSLYLSALQWLEDRFKASPHHTRVSYQIAAFYDQQANQFNPPESEDHRWDRKKSMEICEQAIEEFPESRGAHNCKVLLNQITKPELDFTTEYAVIPAEPSLGLLKWKNPGQIYFRLISYDAAEFGELSMRNNREELAEKLVQAMPIRQWDLSPDVEQDYQLHSAEFKIPALDPGFYVLLASNREDFSGDLRLLAWNGFWSTNLSYLTKRTEEGGQELFILDRESGSPIGNVTVRLIKRDYDYRTRQYQTTEAGSFVSDENGYLRIEASEDLRGAVNFELQRGNDRFQTQNSYYLRSPGKRVDKPREKSYFLTDRAIYRPGQTVYFKAILLEQTGEKLEILPGASTTVEFRDVNNQLISSLDLTSNEYGSVHGSFSIPQGILNGQMSLRNGSGSASVQVEEYKRPTFEVTFEEVEGSYRIGEQVELQGQALGYAGNAIDGAEVSYRVVRRSRFPFFGYGYSRWFPQSPEVEIATGETTTDGEGRFTVSFKAIPDYDLRQELKPVFSYTVEASVTDIGGETQSGSETVSVGYQALFLKTDLPEQVNLDEVNSFKVTAENLSGIRQDATVNVVVFRLEAPDRLITDRLWQQPDIYLMSREDFLEDFPHRVYKNENDPRHWDKDKQVLQQTLNTATDSLIAPENFGKWEQGKYLVKLSATDAFGEKVESESYVTLYQPGSRNPPLPVYNWFVPLKSKAEPGDEAVFLMGTAARNAHVLYEVQHQGKIVSREWLRMGREQQVISVPVKEEYRGNFGITISFVINNRIYQNSMTVEVPFTNKKLDLAFETLRSDLEPGADESWTITIRDKQGDRMAAEMLASMYDASLDAFIAHNWSFDLYHSTHYQQPWDQGMNFSVENSNSLITGWDYPGNIIFPSYDRLNWFGFSPYGVFREGAGRPMNLKGDARVNEMAMTMDVAGQAEDADMPATEQEKQAPEAPPQETPSMPLRTNFNETAFFYPALSTNEDGNVQIKFTLPESFTRWKFMGLAHTKDLMTGFLKEEFTASKKLMVFPNVPRFFRSGDTLIFTTRINNLSEEALSGTASLDFFDATDMNPVNDRLELNSTEQSFSAESKGSTAVSWRIIIPEGIGMLTYRVKATAGNVTDGEERMVPVLPNRMLVTESMPMPVGGNETKDFRFDKLLESGRSQTIENYRLTLEFSSNPAWYAVQALPVIAEAEYRNTISLFGAFFANSMAFHLANANPDIKRIFDEWKSQSPEAFLSNLEKNQELKQLVLEQTPWVLEAKNDSERKRRIALLFDINNMQYRLDESLRQLEKLQSSNGGFMWFDGMRDSRYVTQYVVEGFSKLHQSGVIESLEKPQIKRMLKNAVSYLDERIHEDFQELKKQKDTDLEKNHLSALHIQYLFARSGLQHIMLNPSYETAFNYYKHQAQQYWQKQNLYLQGMIALTLHRYGDRETPPLILKSLRERSLHNDEMGMYWRADRGYYWYQSTIGTQAMLIRAFSEISGDREAVNEMKVWLLKQKQTQDWGNTKATAEAVYALLAEGKDLLQDTRPVQIEMAGEDISRERMGRLQAGTGYFKTSWSAAETDPAMGRVKIENPNDGIAWGALYWQYFEDLDRITPHETPLSLSKALYVKRNTGEGQVLEPLNEGAQLKVGDQVVVRIELRTDRDLEYVHLKDMRAAAFEPVNVISGYRYQGGLGYYETTGDAATSFFFDYLRKGTWVFEYPLIVSQKGSFSNGISTVECMYAPEFSAHSKGIRVEVD